MSDTSNNETKQLYITFRVTQAEEEDLNKLLLKLKSSKSAFFRGYMRRQIKKHLTNA